MRFLANENFPGDAVAALREAGHDVSWVRADAPGIAARIGERTDWMGHFTVIEPARVRMRALSGQGAKPT